jgi:hypothetical protein
MTKTDARSRRTLFCRRTAQRLTASVRCASVLALLAALLPISVLLLPLFLPYHQLPCGNFLVFNEPMYDPPVQVNGGGWEWTGAATIHTFPLLSDTGYRGRGWQIQLWRVRCECLLCYRQSGRHAKP